MIETQASLCQQLKRLDGQSYKAYKALRGEYDCGSFTLFIDYVQGDPFAAPSRVRVQVPQAVAQFPADLYRTSTRAVALADYLTRQFYQASRRQQRRGSGKSGLIAVTAPSQAILARTAASVTTEWVELRFTVGLPGFGRRIAGQEAATLLCEEVPDLVMRSLLYPHLNASAITRHVNTAEDAEWLRLQLASRGLVAFVADGAVLPRRSGVDERPLEDQAIPFQSPATLRVTLDCPQAGPISGMGIPQGVTLIVGGGYHGKSTLLRALEAGVYNHVPGDGREQVVTQLTAMKVRAEDGRSVAGVNISPFISNLPQGRSTTTFSTPNASGSTSQAANIIEAVEAGAQVLLVDEDTSATNFMIRDRRMQALIAKDREPITPFLDKVRQLYTDHGVSTVLVMGGSGDYFDVADTVIALDNYQPQEVTQQAKALAAQYPSDRQLEGGTGFGPITPRIILPNGIDPSQGRREVRLKVRDVDEVHFGEEEIDLSAVEQLVEPGQVRAIAAAMVYARSHYLSSGQPLLTVLKSVMADLAQFGLDCLEDWPTGDLVEFRPLELAAAINRLRSLEVQK
ncbi:MAG: ABC-ATPase domain-containing protein [Cyanobacteria bacterium Co-bin8]|nr:ABC-ATPase domain-containing protein [Cyanobacteria bacterium Co-bin8]